MEQPHPQALAGPSGSGRRVALSVALVVALTGAAVAVFLLTRRTVDPPPLPEVSQAVLTAAGCTADEQPADLGGGHIPSDDASLAAAAPEVLYPDRPTTSGMHMDPVVATGVYDVPIDERVLTHNLEHGYVVVWYDPDAAASDALGTWAPDAIGGGFPKVVVAPWQGDLPDGAAVSFTAWGWRQSCTRFDPQVADAFVAAHHGLAGAAPEAAITAHVVGQQGVLDPNADDVLFPPLG